jgi:penicillin-binding protein-related factor A (putative recombinase)
MTQKLGENFERYLADYHAALRLQGKADVRNVPTPVKIVGRKGRLVTARLEKRYGVDFAGTLRGGRAAYIEAKSRSTPTRFPFSALAAHQQTFLSTNLALGAVCLVLARQTHAGRNTVFVIPWEWIRARQGEGAKSVRWATLLAEGFKAPVGGGWFEWLAGRP